MKNAIMYYLIKLRLILWIAGLITPDSEAVLAMNGGKWGDSMRRVVIEMLLSEVRE